MSSQNPKSPQNKSERKERQLSIRRAEYIKKLKIKVKLSDNKLEDDRLILIETFNSQKNISVQLVMRKLSQLDAFIAHINAHYGGHIIPVFQFNLYYQESLPMNQLVPAIEEYLNDLKHNRYCRQDIKFYCFVVEQHASFHQQYSISNMINNATDISRKYLNQLFTRKSLPSLKNADIMLYAHTTLIKSIDQYYQIKQISLIKSKQLMIFQEITNLIVEMSAWPGMAVEPQQLDIQCICKSVVSCEKLIEQAKAAYHRWEKLVDGVRELQNNVYKGLHEYQQQFDQRNQLLKNWSQTLSQQFYDLSQYLENKMQVLSAQVFKINKSFVDMAVFAGQSVKIQQDPQVLILQNMKIEKTQRKNSKILELQPEKDSESLTQKQKEAETPKLKQKDSFEISEQIYQKNEETKNEPNFVFEGSENYKDMIENQEKQELLQETIPQVVKNKQEITCEDD